MHPKSVDFYLLPTWGLHGKEKERSKEEEHGAGH